MNLRENKSAYIDFVLSLFGVTDRAPIIEGEYTDEYAHKFKVANVYAQKDGNPVEVYPIWEDDYLINIKIDEEYLEASLPNRKKTKKVHTTSLLQKLAMLLVIQRLVRLNSIS